MINKAFDFPNAPKCFYFDFTKHLVLSQATSVTHCKRTTPIYDACRNQYNVELYVLCVILGKWIVTLGDQPE